MVRAAGRAALKIRLRRPVVHFLAFPTPLVAAFTAFESRTQVRQHRVPGGRIRPGWEGGQVERCYWVAPESCWALAGRRLAPVCRPDPRTVRWLRFASLTSPLLDHSRMFAGGFASGFLANPASQRHRFLRLGSGTTSFPRGLAPPDNSRYRAYKEKGPRVGALSVVLASVARSRNSCRCPAG
jgi:hypothetical protein